MLCLKTDYITPMNNTQEVKNVQFTNRGAAVELCIRIIIIIAMFLKQQQHWKIMQ